MATSVLFLCVLIGWVPNEIMVMLVFFVRDACSVPSQLANDPIKETGERGRDFHRLSPHYTPHSPLTLLLLSNTKSIGVDHNQ